MRIDRLLGITVYLLNRGRVSASALAERFEVSRRTIQRDMETLDQAGIPIVATFGSSGGYEILDSFRMEKQPASSSDYSLIVAALQGLFTAYPHPRLDTVLDKMIAAAGIHAAKPQLVLDFGVLREGIDVPQRLSLLERAVTEREQVDFTYCNSEGRISQRTVEPVTLLYKWYAWYIYGFCLEKQAYRYFKLLRMSGLRATGRTFTHTHEEAGLLLDQQEANDSRTYIDFRLFCKAEVKTKAMEYLNGVIEQEDENGDFILAVHVPESEHLWFGTLLALGNRIKVLEPPSLKRRLCEQAREIMQAYCNGDI
ncbi:helix-turn-helix transcriptional regulator [Paenibacillus donghaensis]|uniref:HTH deoR-type domain-containing protein n=1 Tax=Paenibacillus donghaensis TaxID=414771 RepID=A0A2Z2KT50_9BACL|nr:YafY family protein [Paenibacillus donghaensis]ASA22498.1 hypothetical protein B9T62_17945 [Paenibacillus donghaensis]